MNWKIIMAATIVLSCFAVQNTTEANHPTIVKIDKVESLYVPCAEEWVDFAVMGHLISHQLPMPPSGYINQWSVHLRGEGIGEQSGHIYHFVHHEQLLHKTNWDDPNHHTMLIITGGDVVWVVEAHILDFDNKYLSIGNTVECRVLH